MSEMISVGTVAIYPPRIPTNAEIKDGWIIFMHPLEHVQREMESIYLYRQVYFLGEDEGIIWRKHSPTTLLQALEDWI